MAKQDQFPIEGLFILDGPVQVGIVENKYLAETFCTEFIMVRVQVANISGEVRRIQFAGKPVDIVSIAGMMLEVARKLSANDN